VTLGPYNFLAPILYYSEKRSYLFKPGWLSISNGNWDQDRGHCKHHSELYSANYFDEYFGDNDVSMFDRIPNRFECLLTDLNHSCSMCTNYTTILCRDVY